MTITSNILRRDYTANGVNTSYAFDFPIFYESNATSKFSLEVIVADTTGAETTKIETTDYTITYNTTDYVNGVINQGNVVFNTAPANNYTISLLRKVNFTQNNDITTSGSDALPGTALEGSLDKLTLMLLEQKESLNRVFKLPKSSLLDNIEFPIGTSQANQVITVNNAGDNLTTKDLADVGLAPVSTYIKTLLDDTTASQARTTLDVQPLAANLSTLASLASITNLSNFANLTPAANKVLIFNGSGAMALQNRPSNKNAIINGNFNIWQRGGTFNSVANLAYTADRFQYAKSGVMVHDITLSNDAPTVAQAGRLITNSIKIDCTTIDASIGTGDFCLLTQKIEGYNFAPLAQKTMTLSFWVKATKTGKYCVAFRGGGWAYVAEYTIIASNTWEFKTITIEASPASGSWDYTTSVGITVDFVLAGGATYQTTKDTWQSGNFFATANQVNACDSASNDFLITGVQLEEGDVATPFENRTFADELQLCERYFEMLESGIIGAANAGTSYAYWAYKTKKRATPTFSAGVGSQFASTYAVNITHVIVQIVNNFTFIAGYSSASSEL